MERWRKWLVSLVILGVGVAILFLLQHELRHYHYREVVANLKAIPTGKLLIALALTGVSYFVLTLYDVLALRQVGRSPGYPKTAATSFVAFVLSYNLGLSIVSGTAVRVRMYGAWGFTTGEIARVITFSGVTFWLGLMAVAGGLFISGMVDLPPDWVVTGGSLQAIGGLFLASAAAYVGLCASRREPLKIRGWQLPLPSWPTALQQLALGSLDVVLAGSVAWVLMPAGWSFPDFIGVHVLGMTAGLISHVPGGVGVLETVVLYGRPEAVDAPAVLGALIAFRAIYYLLPLLTAVALLSGFELYRQKERVRGLATGAGRWLPRVAPRFLATTTFIAGLVLLASGATPSVRSRVEWLTSVLPLPVLELSHLMGSVIGVLLLFLARGLQRRMDAAYVLTLCLLAGGALFSLLKGFDWEEALVLLGMLGLMLPCREAFQRRSSLFDASFSPGWLAAIVLAVAAAIWLGFFSYRHVQYRDELWWQFAIRGDAPRFLRASVAIAAVAGGLALWRLLGGRTIRTTPADAATIEEITPVVTASPEALAHLALLGDKALLRSPSGKSFIMYGVQGRSWVALGDPVGPDAEKEALIWSFRELADQHGGWSVFYEVSPRHLHLYLDAGLTLTKLGEEARVPLTTFSLEGGARKGLRQTIRRVEREGAVFEWVEPADVPPLLPELRAVSDAWLTKRATREKRFSLGYFDEAYLSHCPLGVVKKEGRVVAFANIWRGAAGGELSVDLMRYGEEAPKETMEYLFIQMMLWGAKAGYSWFSLGMAPLSGMEKHALAPTWHRLGALLYEHGEHFYHFQGLRAYKEKFDPEWTPRYLAAPGVLQLPIILTNVGSLISGGVKGLVGK
ncbi:MAG: bifunctional lysylphosphatidylglycerol flippase/synthetase MprF [Verrucomicrobiota bacterium JB022]|nr:bifunctional lysylphosphatidylglycerol flippase/synthetase MprF [Verrucomicrobiota bacterium JB022]